MRSARDCVQGEADPEEVFSNLINAGPTVEEEVFDVMPAGRHSLERDVFPLLADVANSTGCRFKATSSTRARPRPGAMVSKRASNTAGCNDTWWTARGVLNQADRWACAITPRCLAASRQRGHRRAINAARRRGIGQGTRLNDVWPAKARHRRGVHPA